MSQSKKQQSRDIAIAQERLSGATYKQLATNHGISTTRISQVLSKPAIKDVLESGAQQIISLIPKAIDVYQSLLDKGSDTIKLKASSDILKTTGLAPSHATTQYLTNIYNDYSGTLSNTMQDVLTHTLSTSANGNRLPIGHTPHTTTIDAEFSEVIAEHEQSDRERLGGE